MCRLSIVCLSYERQRFMRRQLAYFANKPVHIVFADGSEKNWGLGERGTIGAMTWNYLHIPGAGTYQERWLKASRMVNTEYVCMMDDADILLWSGLSRAVNFLDCNSDYHYSAGKVASVFHHKPTNEWITGKWGHWTATYNLDGSQPPEERLINLINDRRTANLFYLVVRSSIFAKLVNIITDTKYSFNAAIELLWAGFLAINSPYQMGDYPFWMRTDEPSVPSKLSSSVPRSQWTEQNYPHELSRFKQIISDELSKSGVEPSKCSQITEEYLKIHLEQSVAAEKQISNRSNFRQKILTIFKQSIKRFFDIFGIAKIVSRKKFNNFKKRNQLETSMVDFWKKECKNIKQDQVDDLLEIESLIKEFPHGISRDEEFNDYVKSKKSISHSVEIRAY